MGEMPALGPVKHWLRDVKCDDHVNAVRTRTRVLVSLYNYGTTTRGKTHVNTLNLEQGKIK